MAENDRQDAYKPALSAVEGIAALVRGGTFPLAYSYPPAWRATRDLLRRRNHLMRKRAERLAHIQNTVTQYNLPPLKRKIAYKANRADVARHFPDPELRKSVEVDLALINHYDELLRDLELHLVRTAKIHDAQMFYLLRSVPGVGKILALVLMYEIHEIERFPRVQDFTSYARLVPAARVPVSATARAARRSAVPISSGPSPRRRNSFSGAMNRVRSTSSVSYRSMARARPSPYLRTSWAGRSTTCSSATKLSMWGCF